MDWAIVDDNRQMRLRFAGEPIELATIEIETARLRLRPLARDYTRKIFENFTPEIARYMMPKPAADISETEDFIDAALLARDDGVEFISVICKKKDGEFLGVCGLHARDSDTEPELGIWLKSEAHGYRFGLEAINGLVEWASENLTCKQFIYPVDRANTPSRAIAETLNGVVIGKRKVENISGKILDEVVYGIPPKRSAHG